MQLYQDSGQRLNWARDAVGTKQQMAETAAIALIDVDGTLIKGQSYKYVFQGLWRGRQHLIRLGLGVIRLLPSRIWRKRSLARRLRSHYLGVSVMAWILGGATQQELNVLMDQSHIRGAIRSEMLAEIRQRKQAGCRVVLASTALAPIVQWLAEVVGADGFVATPVAWKNGRLSGKLAGPICNTTQKIAAAEALVAGWPIAINWDDSWAYSDGTPDLPMLEKVGHPVAVDPDAQLEQLARARKWKVIL